MADAVVIRPTIADLGQLMRARTKDKYGNEVGTFNADTRPTAAQAESIIDTALGMFPVDVHNLEEDLIEAILDGDDADARRRIDRVLRAILLLAAVLVEVSYYPEQNDTDQSAAATYERLYNQVLETLAEDEAVHKYAPTTLA